MTRDEAVAEVQRHLAFRRNLQSSIILELINAQQEFEKLPKLPWFLESEMSEVATTAPTGDPLIYEERVPLPTDFLRQKENCYLEVQLPGDNSPPQWRPLNKLDLARIRQHPLRGSHRTHSHHTRRGVIGFPRNYAISAQYFRIDPLPNDAYNLRMIYYKKDTVLQDNIQNLWLANIPQLLIGRALWKLASGGVRDPGAQQLGMTMQQDALEQINNETEMREWDDQPRSMGDEL